MLLLHFVGFVQVNHCTQVQHYHLKIPGAMLPRLSISRTRLKDGQLRPVPMVSVLERFDCSLHLARKHARIFVRGHYLFREENSFPRA